MNGSIRVAGGKAPVLCAPYAFPSRTQQLLHAAPFVPADATATPGVNLAPWAPDTVAAVLQSILVPYVPRDLRLAAETDSIAAPLGDSYADEAERTNSSAPVQTELAEFFASAEVEPADAVASAEAELAEAFAAAEAEPTDAFASQAALFAAVDVPEPSLAVNSGAELPWIDAFTEDSVAEEESWPMDDAGRRLDELAQSLGSLDASRARATSDENEHDVISVSSEASDADVPPDAPVSMWSEDEWMDILPLPETSEPTGQAAGDDAANGSTDLAAARVESAARALEGLAQRVREGGLTVPKFPSDIADEAMLAGLLASMLGWPQ